MIMINREEDFMRNENFARSIVITRVCQKKDFFLNFPY